MIILTVVLAAGSMAALVLVLTSKGKRGKVVDRLAEVKMAKPLEEIVPEHVGQRSNWFSKFLIKLGTLIAPKGPEFRKLRYRINAAGIYSEEGVLIYQGLRVFVPSVLMLLALAFMPLYAHNPILLIIIPVCILLVGLFAPTAVIRSMGSRRKKEFVLGFPDALDLLAVCAEAGVGFDSAMQRVAREMEHTHVHIAKEFQTYLYEQQVGVNKHEALRNLAQRMNVDIIKAFIAVLIQSDKLGTSIAQTLRVYSDALRTQRRQTAEIKAAKRPIYLIFPLMFLMLPSMFLVLMGPALVNIAKTFK
jgi:tight adherence protein C